MGTERCTNCSHNPHPAGKCPACQCLERASIEELFSWDGPERVRVSVDVIRYFDEDTINCGVYVGTGDDPLKVTTSRRLAAKILEASDIVEKKLTEPKRSSRLRIVP